MVRDAREGDPHLTMNDDTTPNENDETTPTGDGPEQPADEQPTAHQQPLGGGPERPHAGAQGGAQATAEQPGPRRLYRSRSDRVIGGVCSGIAKYFAIDPVIVRVATVALIFLGGAGIVAYIAALLLIPNEGEGGAPPQPPRRAVAVVGTILLVCAIGVALPFHGWWGGGWSLLPLGLVAIAGLLVWRLATGERPQGDAGAVLRAMALGVALLVSCGLLAFGSAWAAAAGGNGVVAGVVIAAGVALIAAAFMGIDRARWMILPALAVALPAGLVAAADIDVKGGYGEKTYRPASVDAIRDTYRLGAGKLVVDLRGAHLQPGTHAIKLRLGVGEAQVIVPRNVCVSANSHLGIGGAQVFNRKSGGIDFDHQEERDALPGNTRLLVDANIGLGALEVDNNADEGFDGSPGNTACA
jgi:phage shock protein PspC (stress-responsive transcriptional regulator)